MTIQDRDILVQRLEKDLVGPFEENEIITSRPSDVYLTGILWPKSTKMSPEDDDPLAVSSVSGDEVDESSSSGEEEEVSKSGMTRPSTAGISFAVTSQDKEPSIIVQINFAVYKQMDDSNETLPVGTSRWQRHLISLKSLKLAVGKPFYQSIQLSEQGAPPGVQLNTRVVSWGSDKRLITLTLFNGYQAGYEDRSALEQHSLFQVRIEVYPGPGTQLIARPSRRMGLDEAIGEEDRSTALLYRNALEYAVGHTCSAEWKEGPARGVASMVATAWIPKAIVTATKPTGHPIFNKLQRSEGIQPLSAKWLSQAQDYELGHALAEIPAVYSDWIALQEKQLDLLEEKYRDQSNRNLNNCRLIRDRMAEGAMLIGQSRNMAEAFRLANQAIYTQHDWDPERQKYGSFIWRPFQLGFILLTIASIADRTHPDRNIMDLLWFPTGGGKTEAYLGLIAFLAFYRRLSAGNNPDSGAGIAAMMRYTLRLLTTQQFTRASWIILACEAIRRGAIGGRERKDDLGTLPFSIGLWVGQDATPNTYENGRKGLQGESGYPTPAQITDCPSCKSKLEWYPDAKTESINVRCNNPECILYAGDSPLPIYTVDSDIYREPPTLLIGTVDKFAQIVRKSQINHLFSIQKGFPPDLIVQDELHLISGPLGTLVGLYEVAIDRMFTRDMIIPKIIGSTATIKRASEQVRALFNRDVCQFPPSALNADDSGFAVENPDAPGRLYVGVTTAGRSAKFTLQAVASSLLQSTSSGLTKDGLDHYWTMVSYFNSLRELGGAVVLMQDDVSDSMAAQASRRNETKRQINPPEELTSRRTQNEIREMLDRLKIHAGQEGALDIVLATNMLSVGVDVPRLGLMVVHGQPKGISEYIQATSRVGRGIPGLIVAVLNNAKPRDRSHYESFATWHRTLYRDVEATSVTPFAPRARDRGLRAVFVSMVRHLVPEMLEDPPEIKPEMNSDIEGLIENIISRSNMIDPREKGVARELHVLLEEWRNRNPSYYWNGYKPLQSLLQDAERAAALRALGRFEGRAWPALNNLRSVEPSTRFRLAERLIVPEARDDINGQ